MGRIYRPTFDMKVPAKATRRLQGGSIHATWTRGARRVSGTILAGSDPPRVRISQPVWWADWTDASGKRCRQSTGCKDQVLARQWLAEREAEAERERVGLVSREDRHAVAELNRPIEDHLDAFDDSLLAAGCSDLHRHTTRRYIERLIEDRGWGSLRRVDRSGMEGWLANAQRRGVGARSRNAHLVAVRSLLNWCVRSGRLRANPLAGIPRANERSDARRKRRAFEERELEALFAAARDRPLADAQRIRTGKRRGQLGVNVSAERRACLVHEGCERALSYRTLFFTGLRLAELRSIRVCDVQLDSAHPHLVLSARSAKSRKSSIIPLRPDLAAEIRRVQQERLRHQQLAARQRGTIRAQLEPQSPAFLVPRGFLRILNRDLAFAGIAKRGPDGRTVDLHAFRTSLCTHLARAGVPLRTAQEVMRHSDPSLTANVYTDPALLQVEAAVASLPPLSPGTAAGSQPA